MPKATPPPVPSPDDPVFTYASPEALEAAQRFLQQRSQLPTWDTSVESHRKLGQLIADGEKAATELLRVDSEMRSVFETLRKRALKNESERN